MPYQDDINADNYFSDDSIGEPYYSSQTSPLMGQFDSKLILWMLDPTNIIDEVKNQLRGIVVIKKWDDKNKKFVDVQKKIVDQALINEKGINHIVYLLNFHLGKHSGTSILREDTIVARTKQFGKDLSLLLFEKWQDFEMDFSTITPIRNSIVWLVYMSLMRSKDGSFLDALTRTYKETYSTASYNQQQQQQMQQPKKGMFRNIMGW